MAGKPWTEERRRARMQSLKVEVDPEAIVYPGIILPVDPVGEVPELDSFETKLVEAFSQGCRRK